MGVGRSSRGRGIGVRRVSYPSGAWVDAQGNPARSPNEPAGTGDAFTPLTRERTPTRSKAPNPDPYNYKLIQVKEIGAFLIVEVVYPDCTNFEGKKIMLFKDVTLIDLVNQKLLDPHFFESKTVASPVARFVPTPAGWGMAVLLATALTGGAAGAV